MIAKRMTAEFEKISNLIENFADSNKRKRVRLVGTVIKTFNADDGNYSFIVIDDGTETIRAKAFKESVSLIKKIEEGSFVQVIGWVSFYNDEVYINPEIVSELSPDEYYFMKIKAIKLIGPSEKEPDFNIVGYLSGNPKSTIKQICADLNINKEACIANLKVLLEEGVVYEPIKGSYSVI